MKLHMLIIIAAALVLEGCSGSAESQTPKDITSHSDNITVNTANATNQKELIIKDLSKMSSAELEAEINFLKSETTKIRIKIEAMESLGATKKEIYLERKRLDVLMDYYITLEKAETAQEKAETVESEEMLRKARTLAGIE